MESGSDAVAVLSVMSVRSASHEIVFLGLRHRLKELPSRSIRSRRLDELCLSGLSLVGLFAGVVQW
jgi:hypothetical protein